MTVLSSRKGLVISGAELSSLSGLTLRNTATRTVGVAMNLSLGTSAAMVKSAPLLLDLLTEQGIVGRSYGSYLAPAREPGSNL